MRLIIFIFIGASQFIGPNVWAIKKAVLTTYQNSLFDCLDKKIEIKKIDNHKKLYKNIELFYTLLTSETVYREVLYTQKNELKKLKYEAGVIQIFKILDEDDSLSLLLTEKFSEKNEDYQARHKIRTAEARISQLLFRADIKSDFQKIKETRAKHLHINVVWVDNKIKSLNIEFLNEKKTLNCIQKEQIDICSCRKQTS